MDVIKVNVDAALLEEEGQFGVGMAARNPGVLITRSSGDVSYRFN